MKTTTMIGALFFTISGFSNLKAKSQQTLPFVIKSTVDTKAKGHKISKWVNDHQRKKYIVVISNGSVIEIDLQGKWLRTTQPLPENKLPSALKSAIKPYLNKGFEIDNYILIDDAFNGKFYMVDITSDDEDSTLSIDMNGKLLKKEKR
ncbi:PepSY-like domain-containing protein [Pedobacter sp. UBA4863]|uniref:PepSY-like domain-containing protein n=1 Tax=Pedobacter sp. UBA4863 TaxID=1947060 RepID=UPI0025E129C4|nr:PepSY-like domain-containing protein [Pedobacter sp. UBA4863]